MVSDNREDGISRRHALECMVWVGTAVLWMVSGGVPQSLSLLDGAQAAVAIAQTKPTIPVIVKDTRSVYWQTVLAGARKAGQDFGVEIAERGAQSESDADGQIALLENAVSSSPAAVVIAPAHFAALGKRIDEAAKRVKVIAIDSTADSKALTSVLATDNVQAGRIAADILAERIQKTYADAEGDVALITPLPDLAALDQRAKGLESKSPPNTARWILLSRRLPTVTRRLVAMSWLTSSPPIPNCAAYSSRTRSWRKGRPRRWCSTRRIKPETRSISSSSARTTSSSNS